MGYEFKTGGGEGPGFVLRGLKLSCLLDGIKADSVQPGETWRCSRYPISTGMANFYGKRWGTVWPLGGGVLSHGEITSFGWAYASIA